MIENLTNKIPRSFKRSFVTVKEKVLHDRKTQAGFAALALMGAIYTTSKLSETNKVLYVENKKPNFKSGRILGNSRASYLNSKEAQLNKTAKELLASNRALNEKVNSLEEEILAK